MSSIEDWERQYGEVLQKGDPDPKAAQNKLDLGERNVVRARRDLGAEDPDSALIHAENAMVNAADAVSPALAIACAARPARTRPVSSTRACRRSSPSSKPSC